MSSVAAGAGAASLGFQSAHEADLDERFERLHVVDYSLSISMLDS